MKYLVNSREMRQYDNNTSQILKVPPLLLMEQAAIAAVEEIEKLTEDKKRPILIVCGVGNNGGDGLAVGRMLFLKGYEIELVLVGDSKKASEQNLKQQEILNSYGVPLRQEIPREKDYQMVIDAIFGVGLTRNIEGEYKVVIETMNTLEGMKLALDIPSGVSADDGAVLGMAFRADVTITFAFDKIGLHLWPGNEKSGKIIVKEIGITERSFLGQEPEGMAYEATDLDVLTMRPSHSNKGTFGKLLVIAGSVNMAGAAVLAAKSAYTTGCGLVRLLTPEENRTIIQSTLPEAILTTYDAKNVDLEVMKETLEWADAVLIGPGIGTQAAAEVILKQVLEVRNLPVIMDADALNLLARDVKCLCQPHGEMIVTPHLGEMSRLTGKSISEIQKKLMATARDFSNTYQVTCVLKDERTIVSVPNGKIYVNLSGNAGMATAGSGDVLSGIIASLVVQGYVSEKAAPLGVYLHGAAGDVMVEETGKAGLMASDLIEGVRRILGCKERKNSIL